MKIINAKTITEPVLEGLGVPPGGSEIRAFANSLKKNPLQVVRYRMENRIADILKNCGQGRKREQAKLLQSLLVTLQEVDSKSKFLSYLRDLIKQAGFAYPDKNGNIGRRISGDIIEFNLEQSESLRRLPRSIFSFYQDKLRFLRSPAGEEIRALLGIDEAILQQLDVPLFVRLDMVQSKDNGKLYIVETEPSPAGIGEALGMRDVFNTIYGPYTGSPSVGEGYIQALQPYQDKNIVLFPNPTLTGYHGSGQYVFNYLKKSYKNISYTTSDVGFSVKSDGLYRAGKKVDVLLHYFVPKANIASQSEDNPFYRDIIKLYKDGKLLLFPQPTFDLDNKLFLGLLNEQPDLFPNSSPLLEFLPKTCVYDGTEDIQIPCFLKRGVSTDAFQDIHVLKDATIATEGIREKIKTDPVSWICQELIPGQRFAITSLGSQGEDFDPSRDMGARIEVYLFLSADGSTYNFSDILLTLSRLADNIGSTAQGVMIPGNVVK